MASERRSEYALFLEKVKRTAYVDSLSPRVTLPILKSAFGQFGNVKSVQFIPNYLGPKNISQAALVEMENQRSAKAVISNLNEFPFMICGTPRPVRASLSQPEMFGDRPKKPGRKIQCRWVDPSHPDFEVAKKLRQLVRKHSAEASFILELQLEEEEKLAKQQEETLKANHQKLEKLDGLIVDKATQELAHHYNMGFLDDRWQQ